MKSNLLQVLGISKAPSSKITVVALDEDFSVAKTATIDQSGIKEQLRITQLDDDAFLTIARTRSGDAQLFSHSLTGDHTRFATRKNANLDYVFVDPTTKDVYAWDWDAKRIFRWDPTGSFKGFEGHEVIPSACATYDGKLIVGSHDGSITYNWKKVHASQNPVKKLVVMGDRLISVHVAEHKGVETAIQSHTYALPSLEKLSDIYAYNDAVCSNGTLYTAQDISIQKHTKSSVLEKQLTALKGYLRTIIPVKTKKKDAIIYLTTSGDIGVTANLEQKKSEEPANLINKGYHRDITLL